MSRRVGHVALKGLISGLSGSLFAASPALSLVSLLSWGKWWISCRGPGVGGAHVACGLLHLICKFKWEFRTQGRGLSVALASGACGI